MPTLRSLLLPAFLSAVAAGCSSSQSGGCNPADASSCPSGLTCEPVAGGGTVCAAPVQLSGKVFDLANPTPGISGARVVALDASQAPLAPAATTNASGGYTIAVPATRNPDGSPTGSVTLRADAAGYQTFPSGLRTAIPVALSTAVIVSGMYQVTTAATDIGLMALPPGNYAALHGTVAASPSASGALVVATPASGGPPYVSGVADKSGTYHVYNVPLSAGTSWTVKPYAKGANYTTSVTLPIALANLEDKQVDFAIGSTPPYTLQGQSIQFAGQNKPSTAVTSVVLVVRSTFDPTLHRGEAPPGLRDGSATGSGFTITGVPDGDYMVLAAFENDGWVQDTGQGSTGYYEVIISGGALTQVLLAGTPVSNNQINFKVTGAISLATPFIDAYDSAPWPANTATPTFHWADYPSSATYDVQVIDYLGNVACSKIGIPYGTTSFAWNSGDCSGATGTTSGTWYQFIVRAYQTGGALASRSEDLKGVFYTP